MKRFASILAVSAILGSSPQVTAATNSTTPYEIDAILPLTGGGAFLGKSYQQAFTAIESVVNKGGGINGRPVKFVISDTQTNPQIAVQLANGIIAKKAAVFIDGGPSPTCGATAPLVDKTGPVEYCLSPVLHPANGSYVFSGNISSEDLVRVTLRYFREQGWTKLGVIAATDATGQDFDRQLDAALALPENRAVTVVGREHFNSVDLSVSAQISRINAAAPTAILAWATGTPFGTLLHGISDAGINLPVAMVSSNMIFDEMSAFGSVLPKQLYTAGPLAMTVQADAKGQLRNAQSLWLNAFKAMGVRPDLAHNLVWDPALIVIEALRHSGANPSAEQVRAYIARLRGWVGVNGTYDFVLVPQRGVTENALAIDRWDPAKNDWTQQSAPAGYPRR